MTNSWVELVPCLFLPSLQSGMNLQICFVNDSGSDKDSDADDSKTETSLDTPLSPMVSPEAAAGARCVCFTGRWASFLPFIRNERWTALKRQSLFAFLDAARS